MLLCHLRPLRSVQRHLRHLSLTQRLLRRQRLRHQRLSTFFGHVSAEKSARQTVTGFDRKLDLRRGHLFLCRFEEVRRSGSGQPRVKFNVLLRQGPALRRRASSWDLSLRWTFFLRWTFRRLRSSQQVAETVKLFSYFEERRKKQSTCFCYYSLHFSVRVFLRPFFICDVVPPFSFAPFWLLAISFSLEEKPRKTGDL